MSYELSQLTSNVSEPKVYDTIVMTYVNQKEPTIDKFENEIAARSAIQHVISNWMRMNKAISYKIVDDHNIILYMNKEPVVLITLEYEIQTAELDFVTKGIPKGLDKKF